MAFDMESIQIARIMRPLRLIALGRPKVGKSTFAASAPGPVVLPIKNEEGIDDLSVPAFPVIQNYANLMEAIGTLYSGDHEFKTVVIDSISALEPLIWDEVCRVNGVDSIEKVLKGFGKGYTEATKQWREVIEGLDALRNDRGMGCILVGHVKVKKFNDPLNDAYDEYSFDINDKAVELLTRWADGVLFFNRKVAVKKEENGFGQVKARAIDTSGGKPYMYTQERPGHPGGGRGAWGSIPYELPFGKSDGWKVLSDALEKARAAEQK